ncbi:alpha/beta hydrolase [Mycolicibacterium neoaurum]|uniref:alpha/beta hydrolase n=1 Tax=Mycolicibacterium neoaurum TaxID=1795 RepID=UPI002672E690|nr:alpha/beta hydrolase [Mycolicibacterium neoaurum]MDO3401703.1 alpha/beta hydrolase [Mycolicibacterium neoaurum]
MTLAPDAQAFVDMMASAPGPLHSLGVDGAREAVRQLAALNPPPQQVFSVQDREIPGPAGPIPIRVYRPSDETGCPILVYFHGGGWTIGNLDTVDPLCRALSAQANCVVVSVDYRLAPENPFPAAVDDGYAAVEWTAAHADQIGGDPERIAVGGDSAGANISTSLCILSRDNNGPKIVYQLLAYPATEHCVERPSWVEHAEAPVLTAADVTWFWSQYLRSEADRCDPRATPANAESLAGLPPALIITAEVDPIRDDGEHYGELLRTAGVDVTVARYPGTFHGFFTMVGMIGQADTAVLDATERLKQAFAQAHSER